MFGLAVCVGVSLSAAVRYWATMAGPPLWGGAGHRVVSIHAEQAPHADSPRLLATNHELLANLRLPAACLSPPQGANSLVQTAHAAAAEGPPRQTPVGRVGEGRPMHSLASFPTPSTHQECCTKCHHAGAGKEIPAAAASTVRHNCVLCHGDMPRAAADAW
jgi:hypothetical protein